MYVKVFVAAAFFLANVFTNVAICSNLLRSPLVASALGAEEQADTLSSYGSYFQTSKETGSEGFLTLLGSAAPSGSEEERSHSFSPGPNLGLEDEILHFSDSLSLSLKQRGRWFLELKALKKYYEILLPPPRLS